MLKNAMRWLQAHLPPWLGGLPSPAIEAIGGLILCLPALLLAVFGHSFLAALGFVLAQAVSEAYERFIDPNGYEPEDVVERARMIVTLAAMVVAIS